MVLLLFLGGFLLFLILSLVFLGIWVYKDATIYGMDKKMLWVALAVLFNPPLGLIVYLVVRKEQKKTCSQCFQSIKKSARYCDACGAEADLETSFTPAQPKKHRNLLIASGLAFVLMIGTVTTFTVLAVVNEDFQATIENTFDGVSMNFGSVTRRNTQSGNTWTLDIIRLGSGSFQRRFNHTTETSHLLIDMAIGEGDVVLIIEQGNITEEIELNAIQFPFELSLENFDPGRITVRLRGRDVRNMRGEISLR